MEIYQQILDSYFKRLEVKKPIDLSETDLLELHSIVGDLLYRALDIVDCREITLYSLNEVQIFSVPSGGNLSYIVFDQMQHSKILLQKGLLTNKNMITQSQIPNTKFKAQICNLKNFIDALKAINFQMDVNFSIDSEGIQVTADDANCFQAVLYITMSGFSEYELQENVRFRINLNVMCDCLGIFHNPDSSLRMIYKGDGCPFVLLMEDVANNNCITECSIKTQCEIDTLNLKFSEDSSINNQVIIKAASLLEMLSEIDKSCEEIQLTLSPSAPYFRIRTIGVIQTETDFEVDKSSEAFIAFNCQQESSFSYRTNHIKYLMRSLSLASKVAISTDQTGLLNCQVVLQASENDRSDDLRIYIEYFLIPLSDNGISHRFSPVHIR